MRSLAILMAVLALALSGPAAADPTADLTVTHGILPDVVYQTADSVALKLDIYLPRANMLPGAAKTPVPTLVFFHGGGWVRGSKDITAFQLMPYLARGWAAVAVQYRLAGQALAPAAVEDARCAVWWVRRHAAEYGFDAGRIVLSGQSAGGHLALIAAMLPASAGFDARCPQVTDADPTNPGGNAAFPELPVAAVVNWSGMTDVTDLIAGPHMKAYAVQWLGSRPDRETVARRVSPLTYVRPGLPPILTLHGDQDSIVPYDQAVRLHAALDRAKSPNRLHTIKGRGHFLDFTPEDARAAFAAVEAFLAPIMAPKRN